MMKTLRHLKKVVHLLIILFYITTVSASTFLVTAEPGSNDLTHNNLNNSRNIEELHTENSNLDPSNNFVKIEEDRYETFTIKIPQLNNKEKEIFTLLPSNYESSNISYPVIYLQNAQEVFKYSFSENGYGYWSLNVPLYEFFTSTLSQDVIIIGSITDSVSAWDEYSPWVNDHMYYWMDHHDANRVEGGDGDAFLDFLTETLKPQIDSQYRTLPNRENTTIAGAKMGGLISIYAGFTKPDVFSRVIALSPSIWFAENGGPWLSKNRLMSLIKKSGRSEKVSFIIDITSKDRTTDSDFYPVIYDSRGKKISFSQAYLEGAQQLVHNLIDKGLPTSYSSEGIDYSGESNELLTEITDITAINSIYLPIIFTPPPLPPAITSAASTTFTKGVYKEFSITSTGNPSPLISYTGTLPNGIEFRNNGNGTADLYGTTTEAIANIFPLTITANNGVSPTAVQNFDLIVFVPSAPSITSKNTTTFYTNEENSFLIVATGEPIPTITINGTLPSWLSFENHGNGTATLSGTPPVPATVKSYSFSIVASNGVSPEATQTFTLKVAYPASLKCPTSDSCILPIRNLNMSPYLNRIRTIWVYLPPNYNSSGDFYQVIYLTDAQDLFAADIGVTLPAWRDYQFDEKLTQLYAQYNKGTIAVAIEFDADYQWDEYSAWSNKYMYYWLGDSSQNFTGVGANFLSFIVKELKPTIDSSFRTLPGRSNTAIGGGSRCGLFALYAGLVRPDVFSKVMAMSPAIWVANNSRTWLLNNGFFNWFESHKAPDYVRYYLYVGDEEWSGNDDSPPPPPNLTTDDDWPIIYLEGVKNTEYKLRLDDVPEANIFKDIYYGGASWPPAHLPSTWYHYIDDALLDLGFY